MNGIRSVLNPTPRRSFVISSFSSVYRVSEYSGFVASILLIAMITCSTPSVFARYTCSRVWVWTPSAAPTTITA